MKEAIRKVFIGELWVNHYMFIF